jgi:hypothetical protein
MTESIESCVHEDISIVFYVDLLVFVGIQVSYRLTCSVTKSCHIHHQDGGLGRLQHCILRATALYSAFYS